jgi:hypothetical protein
MLGNGRRDQCGDLGSVLSRSTLEGRNTSFESACPSLLLRQRLHRGKQLITRVG